MHRQIRIEYIYKDMYTSVVVTLHNDILHRNANKGEEEEELLMLYKKCISVISVRNINIICPQLSITRVF